MSDFNFPINGGGLTAGPPKTLADLESYLASENLQFQRVEGQPAFTMLIKGENGVMVGFAGLVEETEQFLFYVSAPQKAPAENLPAVAEFITRANWGLRIGNFELDYSDGEVRFKSAYDYESGGLVPLQLRNTMAPAVRTMDIYMNGLLAVMFGGKSAADAIHEIENPAPEAAE